MESLLDRLSKFIDNEGIKIGSIEKNVGASRGVLSHAMSKNTDIQAKWVSLILENYPQLSAEWLLTGDGTMYNNTSGDGAISRIMEILKEKGNSTETVETQMGMSIGSLQRMCERKSYVNEDLLRKVLAICPDVSAEWILTGEGKKEKELINKTTDIGSEELRIKNHILTAKYEELDKLYHSLLDALMSKR